MNLKIKSTKGDFLDFYGKKVLVLGLGIQSGGVEAVKFLWRRGAKITVTDLRPRQALQESLQHLQKYRHIRYVLGRHRKSDIRAADCIVKNPGISPRSPYLGYARRLKIPILTDMGLFFELCPAPIIGITGSRGKSTAAYLIWRFLNSIPRFRGKTYLAGNIGSSVLAILPKLDEKSMVVLELSSFQLQDLSPERKSPHLAVITNIYRDHLNWHRNFQEYIAAKRIIVRYQTPRDRAFINSRDRNVRTMTRHVHSRVISVKLPMILYAIVDKNLGVHYRPTVALAVALGKHFGVSSRRMIKILKKFRGLPGRQEKIGTVRGVHFVNDTTATIPDAAIAAIERFSALKNQDAKLILIAGGSDKKLDFGAMSEEIRRKVNTLILLPGDGTEKIKKVLNIEYPVLRKNKLQIKEVKNMGEAVKTAWRTAQTGDWIILSPGAASFGLFLNEFDRGKQFIKELKKIRTDYS